MNSGSKRLRILILAPDSDPDSVSTSLIGYRHSEAMAKIHDVTLIIRKVHEKAVRSVRAPFHAIEIIYAPWLDRIYAWCVKTLFKNDYGSQALTAFSYPFSQAIEWYAWCQLRTRIKSGEFDVVLRIMPGNPIIPSPLAFFLRRGPIPFVIGPLNGGLPWPKGFSQADRQKEWISGLRRLYRFLPFAHSTYRNAAAIIVGSSHIYAELAAYRDKLFFVPENGISPSSYPTAPRRSSRGNKLEVVFVGRLVPYKACDLALRAVASLLQKNRAHFTILGDGPERNHLVELAKSLSVEKFVSFSGWLNHTETLKRLQEADIMVFPSVREFGGGVVFEALASGVVPVVSDYGGPGDIVQPEVGYKVALTNQGDIVNQMEKILSDLDNNRTLLDKLRQQGMRYAHKQLSWDGKAQIMTKILYWVVGHGPKPDFLPPQGLPLRES
jgi:glycosyltransferase involved in cell wall biosynthesis